MAGCSESPGTGTANPRKQPLKSWLYKRIGICAGRKVASTCSKDFLRPAAVTAGVIAANVSVRFGWHNLRHSLGTFFGSKELPINEIRQMLRHKDLRSTQRYTHAVNSQQVAAQGMFLEAIKLSGSAN
jgi:integrase